MYSSSSSSSSTEEKHIINISEVGLRFISCVHALLLIMWAASSCIDSFNTGIFHTTPIAFEIFVLFILLSILGFPIDWERDLKAKRRQLIFFMVILIIGFGFNVTHLVFSVIEIAECTSNLCLNTFWVLAVFIALLSGFLVLEVVEFVLSVRYYQNAGVLEKIKPH
jgi:hypothetical protein